LNRVLDFHKKVLSIENGDNRNGFLPALQSFTRVHGTTKMAYLQIKEAEGNYLKYYSGLKEDFLHKEDYKKVTSYLSSIRQSIHAAKSIHDIRSDLMAFHTSANNYLFHQFDSIRQHWNSFDRMYMKIFVLTGTAGMNELARLKKISFDQYKLHAKQITEALHKQEIEQVEASTLLNVYQEMFSSEKALLRALAFLLFPNEMEEMEFFAL
jgi:hypothetical protein